MKRTSPIPLLKSCSMKRDEAIHLLERNGNLKPNAARDVLASGAVNDPVAKAVEQLAQRTIRRQDAAWIAPSAFMMVLP